MVCFVNYIKKSKYDHSWWGNGLLAISNISTARQKNVTPSSRLLYTFRGVLAKLASTLMNDGKVFKMCLQRPLQERKDSTSKLTNSKMSVFIPNIDVMCEPKD